MPHASRPLDARGRKRHDGKTPDRFTVNGWRRVGRGGYVRFGQARHYHEELAKHEGQWVFAETADHYAVNINVYLDTPWDHRTPGNVLYCSNEILWFADQPDLRLAPLTPRPSRGW